MGRRAGWVLVVPLCLLVVASAGSAPSTVHNHGGSVASPGPTSRLPAESEPGARPELPLAANGQLRLIVGSHDPTLVPNTGIRCTFTDWGQSTLPNDTSFQVGGEETIGNYTAVFGIFENTQLNPRPFFSIFEARSNTLVRLVYWNTFGAIPGASYDFRLAYVANTTWGLSVNGFIFGGNATTGDFNFGVTQATNASSIGFSEVAFVQTTSPVPANLSVPVAFAVLRDGDWKVPEAGFDFFSPANPVPWGVVGRSQEPFLAPDQLLTGTHLPLTANNTTLWTGGAVPVTVTLSSSSSQAVGTGGLILTATVVLASNSTVPLVNVSVSFQDTFGSVFSPSPSFTDLEGTATVAMVVANVSVPMFDSVLATVELLGYAGSASIGFEVTPPPQVLFAVVPTSVDVSHAATYNLTVEATYATGVPAAFLTLSVTVTGPANVEPVQVTTGTNGWTNVTLSVEGTPGKVVLFVTVAYGGAWGSLTADLGEHPSFDFWAVYGPYLVGAAIGAVVAVLVWLAARHFRRRRPMPAMGFAPNQEIPLSTNARPARPNGDASRTPPEGGTP